LFRLCIARLNILLLMYHFPFKSSTPARFKVKLSCLAVGRCSQQSSTTIQTYSPEKISSAWRVQFHTLLVSAINNPETAIAQLEILSPVERQQLLVNNTKPITPKQCVYISCSSIRQDAPWSSRRCFENQQLTMPRMPVLINSPTTCKR